MQNRRRIFTLTISFLVLLGFMATSLIGYFVARDSTSDQLQKQMLPLTSDNIYSEIQRDLLQPLLISSLMANDTFVIDWAQSGEEDPERLAEYLAQIQRKYNTITAFFVSEKKRNYYHSKGIIKQVDENDPADKWYFNTRQLNTDYDINIDWDTAEPSRMSIFVNYRVLNQQGELIGVTGVGLSMESVAHLIENYQRRYGREIYFVDRQGEITLRSSQFQNDIYLQNKEGLDQLFVKILSNPSASVSYAAKNGHTIYLNSRLVPEFDWFLIVEQINDPAADRIETALWINIAVSLAISVCVLMLAHFTIRGYQRRLEAMATKDKLTGATSRQVFDWIFSKAQKTALRKDWPLSMIVLDIDHFKSVNDKHGHHFGDQVLKSVSRLIKQKVREVDTLCRWGGEEFLLLLENCDQDHAAKIAESIREAISEHEIRLKDDTIKVTISAGLAEYELGESMDNLIERCDHAMYESKNKGRNRITVY